MTVGIIDYGAGNFASVWNAFQKHGRKLIAVTEAADLRQCSHVVLPGVGAFSSAMEQLAKTGLTAHLRELLLHGTTPFLGICVGMQVLGSRGTELTPSEGLGIVQGAVTKLELPNDAPALALPHMGWSDVAVAPGSVMFRGIDIGDPSFYFLHSYALQSTDGSALFSYCDYGRPFIAALEKGSVFGVQFHPEKSQRNGNRLIANFLDFTGG